MWSKKRIVSFNVFLVGCLLACFAVASMSTGCRSRETRPADDEPSEKVGSTGRDADICEADSGVPRNAAAANAPIGDEHRPLVLSPVDTCNQASPASEPCFLHDVWKRALEHLGPQDLTKPPSRDACETAEVLKRIGITDADTILSRCPLSESTIKAPATKSTAPPALSLGARAPRAGCSDGLAAPPCLLGGVEPRLARAEAWS